MLENGFSGQFWIGDGTCVEVKCRAEGDGGQWSPQSNYYSSYFMIVLKVYWCNNTGALIAWLSSTFFISFSLSYQLLNLLDSPFVYWTRPRRYRKQNCSNKSLKKKKNPKQTKRFQPVQPVCCLSAFFFFKHQFILLFAFINSVNGVWIVRKHLIMFVRVYILVL